MGFDEIFPSGYLNNILLIYQLINRLILYMIINWKGIFPALTRKFTYNHDLDIPAYLLNIKKQIEAGVHGLVIGGSLGEASTLTQDEKNKLLQATVS